MQIFKGRKKAFKPPISLLRLDYTVCDIQGICRVHTVSILWEYTMSVYHALSRQASARLASFHHEQINRRIVRSWAAGFDSDVVPHGCRRFTGETSNKFRQVLKLVKFTEITLGKSPRKPTCLDDTQCGYGFEMLKWPLLVRVPLGREGTLLPKKKVEVKDWINRL